MSAIHLSIGFAVKSVATNRKAHCKNCWDFSGDKASKVIPAGQKRVVIQIQHNRTLYLCSTCAAFEAERLESLAADLRRAIAGWIDTQVEWEANRDAS